MRFVRRTAVGRTPVVRIGFGQPISGPVAYWVHRMCRDIVASTIEQNVLNEMGAAIKRWTAAITIGILFWASGARADTVVVTAERMIDVLAGRTLMRPQNHYNGWKDHGVSSQDAPAPAGARRIDLPGMTLLPGLIDMHVHLTADPRFSGYRRLEFTDSFWTVVGVANAKRTLEAGFTTVRNVGSAGFDDVALKQGIEHGYVPGPRIVPATYQ